MAQDAEQAQAHGRDLTEDTIDSTYSMLGCYIFFWFFGINDSISFSIENWILLKPVLGGAWEMLHFSLSLSDQNSKNTIYNETLIANLLAICETVPIFIPSL